MPAPSPRSAPQTDDEVWPTHSCRAACVAPGRSAAGRIASAVSAGVRCAVGGGRTRTGQVLDLMPLPVGLPRRAPGRIRTVILSTLSRAPLPVGLQGLRGTGENRTLLPKQRGYGPRGTPPAQPSPECVDDG